MDDRRRRRRRAGRACLARRYGAEVPQGQRAVARDSRGRTRGRELCGVRARSASRGCRARDPFRRRGDGELWGDKSGGHVPLCQAGRRADGLSDAAPCGGGVAAGVRYGAAAARQGQFRTSPAAARTCCCRSQWRRCGPSRSLRTESLPVSSATRQDHGSGMSASTPTRPAATFMSPIPSRQRSSTAPSAPSMRPRRKPGRAYRCAASCPVRPRVAGADRAVLRARQLNAPGAARIRRACRRARSLCPAGARWRGHHRCGVRAQAPDRAPQGRRSRFVRLRRLPLAAAIALGTSVTAQAHQVNLSTARVTLAGDRSVSVEVGAQGQRRRPPCPHWNLRCAA